MAMEIHVFEDYPPIENGDVLLPAMLIWRWFFHASS